MTNKVKLAFFCCALVLIVGVFTIYNRRIWDSTKMQKLVASSISKGDSRKAVSSRLSNLNMKQTYIDKSTVEFDKRQEIKDSGLKPKSISSFIVGECKQGILPDDRYYTQFFFFFDVKDELIKSDVLNSYAGI